VRTYLLLAAAEFRRYSTYRLAIFAGVVTQSVFGFIRVSVLFAAIAAAGGTLAGYDQRSASTYVWLGQALLAPIAIFGWTEIAERVSSGEIAVDFARPVDLQLAWWTRDLGRAGFQLLSRGLPPLLIGALTIGLAFAAVLDRVPARSDQPRPGRFDQLRRAISAQSDRFLDHRRTWLHRALRRPGRPTLWALRSGAPLSGLVADHRVRHSFFLDAADAHRRALWLGA